MTMTNEQCHARSAAELYRQLPIPADKRSIRVFDVQAPLDSEVDDGGPIEGNLRLIDLGGREPFSALSYVWGASANEPHTVTCAGLTVNVTINCHAALRHLRKRLQAFTVWVDAICITRLTTRKYGRNKLDYKQTTRKRHGRFR
jgi:hypothetical protein